jgi:hypothetical protein
MPARPAPATCHAESGKGAVTLEAERFRAQRTCTRAFPAPQRACRLVTPRPPPLSHRHASASLPLRLAGLQVWVQRLTVALGLHGEASGREIRFLNRAEAERLTARAISERKNLDALVGEMLEGAPPKRPSKAARPSR